jgi:hypothetical protein
MKMNCVAEIYCQATRGAGSGYLVTPELVLTALHTITPDKGPVPLSRTCEVRLQVMDGSERQWRTGTLVWPTDDDWEGCAQHDVALIGIAADEITSRSASEPIKWGLPVQYGSSACRALGFPKGREDEQRNQTWLLEGSTSWASGWPGLILYVGLSDNDACNLSVRFGSDLFWPGYSGAALFVDERLVGVISAVSKKEKMLTAARVERALQVESFARQVGISASHVTSMMFAAIAQSRTKGIVDDCILRPTDIKVTELSEEKITNLAQLLERCTSISCAQETKSIATELPPYTRSLIKSDTVQSIVSACACTDALSTLLEAVRSRENNSDSWSRVLWGLLEFKSPILPEKSLRELRELGDHFDPGCNVLSEVFRRAISKLHDVHFELPRTWAEAIVLLSDFRGEGDFDPPLILLTEEIHRGAPPDQKEKIINWLKVALKFLGRQLTDRETAWPIASSGSAFLGIAVESAIARPGDGFCASASLVVEGTPTNLGSIVAFDLECLKEWVSKCELDAVQRPALYGRTLIIEFSLPDDMLSKDVDQWAADSQDPSSFPLGVIHPVVVRSLWRLRDPSAARYGENWRRLCDRAVKDRCIPIYFVETPHGITPQSLYAKLKLSAPVSVTFGFAPDGPSGNGLIAGAIRAGAPIIVWPRIEDAARADFEGVISGDFENLPNRVLVRRLKALEAGQQTDLGHRLSVLCDDCLRLHDPTTVPLTDSALR